MTLNSDSGRLKTSSISGHKSTRNIMPLHSRHKAKHRHGARYATPMAASTATIALSLLSLLPMCTALNAPLRMLSSLQCAHKLPLALLHPSALSPSIAYYIINTMAPAHSATSANMYTNVPTAANKAIRCPHALSSARHIINHGPLLSINYRK